MAEEESRGDPILDRLPSGLFAIDQDWRVRIWNATIASWTSLDAEDSIGRDLRLLLPSLAETRYSSRLETLLAGGPPVVFSYELNSEIFAERREGPRARRLRTVATSLPEGGILFTVEDRTEVAALLREARREVERRKAVEGELRAAIEAKEMLIREVSHRVKNNLAMIVSLIDMESSTLDEGKLREKFEDLEARIESIAFIHELLYKSDLGADIRLDEYLHSLGESIMTTFLPEGSPAALEFELAPLSIDIDTTLYLGLIVAELLTNSLKYAIAPRSRGLIKLSSRIDGEGGLELIVADDGPGFKAAKALGAPRGPGLGRGLISLLVRELGGSFEILEGGGATVLISIPLARGAMRASSGSG